MRPIMTLSSEEIVKLIHGEVEKVNKTLAVHEVVKRERIVLDDWSADNDLLSQTLKLKRVTSIKNTQISSTIYSRQTNQKTISI